MKRLLRTIRRSEDGQAIVELALVLPILLLVVLGIFDFGRAVNYWNDETHVASLAARYASVGTLPTAAQDKTCGGKSTLTEYVKCEVKIDSPELAEGSSGKSGAQGAVAVCVSIPEAKVGGSVTVKVSAKYKWLPFFKFGFTESGLAGSATSRLEQIPPAGFATTTGSC
jgi:Flp pilus assembly protein TadG